MGGVRGVPHPFPYQGSKRQLASKVVGCIPARTRRLVEPFAGSAAISIASAYLRRSERFWINDLHTPLFALWRSIISQPDVLADRYARLWHEQRGQEREFYDAVRDRFNARHEAHCFLYLLARCVKAAIRYNGRGEFNNSPDNRRLGMHPDTMRANLRQTSALLQNRVELTCLDYRDVLTRTKRTDVVYMDPPYQGVCATRDHRYCGGVDYDVFVTALVELNRRSVPYVVSYDGRTGDKVHGRPLPDDLELTRHEIPAGRSTQATLLGRSHNTVESLYLSPALVVALGGVPRVLTAPPAPTLF
jgi:DNA adenine methylase